MNKLLFILFSVLIIHSEAAEWTSVEFTSMCQIIDEINFEEELMNFKSEYNKKCSSGTYYGVNDDGVIDCYKCTKGHYIRNQYVCCECNKGSISTSDNSLECELCPQKQGPNKDHTACEDCPIGTYSNAEGSGCLSCGSGAYSANKGSSYCVDCPAGYGANSDGSDCQPCPIGYEAPEIGSGCSLAESLCGKPFR